MTWYFHSPLLETAVGLPVIRAYADIHFFGHFQDYGTMIGLGTESWVNRP